MSQEIPDVITVGNEYYIRARSSPADTRRTLLLMRQDLFAVFDRHGDFQPISADQPGKLRDLATVLELCGAPRQLDAKHIPWIYYVTAVALRYLDEGLLPTKRQVKQEAIRQRVLEELLLSRPPGEALAHRGVVVAKYEDTTRHKMPGNWRRIFSCAGSGRITYAPKRFGRRERKLSLGENCFQTEIFASCQSPAGTRFGDWSRSSQDSPATRSAWRWG